MDPAFLAEDNICGNTLLRLVSRGNSLIAELFRLSQNLPPFLSHLYNESSGNVCEDMYIYTHLPNLYVLYTHCYSYLRLSAAASVIPLLQRWWINDDRHRWWWWWWSNGMMNTSTFPWLADLDQAKYQQVRHVDNRPHPPTVSSTASFSSSSPTTTTIHRPPHRSYLVSTTSKIQKIMKDESINPRSSQILIMNFKKIIKVSWNVSIFSLNQSYVINMICNILLKMWRMAFISNIRWVQILTLISSRSYHCLLAYAISYVSLPSFPWIKSIVE